MSPDWIPNGDSAYVDPEMDRAPDFDPLTAEHLWTIGALYRWGGPSVEQPTLDHENLLMVTGPGCYHCEQMYSSQVAARRCPGTPDSDLDAGAHRQ